VSRAAAPARFKRSEDVNLIDADLGHLHPVMRFAVREVVMLCKAECLTFQMFEGFRSPQRQDHIYLQGRAPSRPGQILTQHRAWESYHQFGLAADFGMVVGSEWYFDMSPANDLLWTRLREIGEDYGLESLEGEKGHLQYGGLEIDMLRKGSYPGGGDRSWEENLWATMGNFPIKSPAQR